MLFTNFTDYLKVYFDIFASLKKLIDWPAIYRKKILASHILTSKQKIYPGNLSTASL